MEKLEIYAADEDKPINICFASTSRRTVFIKDNIKISPFFYYFCKLLTVGEKEIDEKLLFKCTRSSRKPNIKLFFQTFENEITKCKKCKKDLSYFSGKYNSFEQIFDNINQKSCQENHSFLKNCYDEQYYNRVSEMIELIEEEMEYNDCIFACFEYYNEKTKKLEIFYKVSDNLIISTLIPKLALLGMILKKDLDGFEKKRPLDLDIINIINNLNK